MSLLTRLLVLLVILGIIDMAIPVPILAILLIYIVLQKPEWFMQLVKDFYEQR